MIYDKIHYDRIVQPLRKIICPTCKRLLIFEVKLLQTISAISCWYCHEVITEDKMRNASQKEIDDMMDRYRGNRHEHFDSDVK